ncbi:hypothetical protein ILUMI_24648 [Ignelater luminosus]|uniref:Uncharacterized protein n=1 Tax=Ignelater luminosus TaxID=2038154 RepID=A0A8K0CD35_IGNLU|nr:hypothetical protein ILUMI_24648 [Ignelater luminosus]
MRHIPKRQEALTRDVLSLLTIPSLENNDHNDFSDSEGDEELSDSDTSENHSDTVDINYEKLEKVVDFVINRNAFFARPENLLLSLLSDEQTHERELTARRILKAREMPTSGQLWVFEVPKINLNVSFYIDLIDWQQYSQPPILCEVSNETLHFLLESGGNDKVLFLRLPCHTKPVERAVTTVPEASVQLYVKESREALIKTKIHSRKRMPKFDSKKIFKVL